MPRVAKDKGMAMGMGMGMETDTGIIITTMGARGAARA